MTEKEFEAKKKDFKGWARKDAKHYLFGNPNQDTIEEYFKRCISTYNSERLIKQFNYTKEQADEILNWYNEYFWEGFNYWQKKNNKIIDILAKYNPIFEEAEDLARKVDISDIEDGFPCGDCHLYLTPSSKDTDLGKALKLKNYQYSTPPSYLQLPIKLPVHGQCMAFSERICEKIQPFLEKKGIPTLMHRWVD